MFSIRLSHFMESLNVWGLHVGFRQKVDIEDGNPETNCALGDDHRGITFLPATCGCKFDEPDEDKVKTYLIIVVGGIYPDCDRRQDCDRVTDPSIERVSLFSVD